ncbi:GNAT family N-acetyltransferase [Chloroflexota bacterium]
MNRENNSVETDIIIDEDADTSKDYGTDALKTLTDYLFQKMEKQLCWLEVFIDNSRAIRAYEKAGFKTTKTFVSDGVACHHIELRKR